MRHGLTLLAVAVLAIGASTVASPAAGELLTSDTCGECHKDIYRMWKASAHARSMEGETFLQSYRETKSREEEEVSRLCLDCHAPLAEITGDWSLQRKVTWEGVNCDVCHSLVSVELSHGSAKQVLDVGDVKRGPIADAISAGHDVAFSELHTTSLVCAGCHEYTNAEGIPILTTYSEWMESGSAEKGETCLSCHMGRTEGDVVDPRIARVALAEINLHQVPGGHSVDLLNKALGVAIEPSRDGDTLEVAIRLTNRGAGHAVPTGMPGRRVILALQVRSYDGTLYEEQRIYGKFFTDADGETITRDSRYFTEGVRLESDSRIGADEQRIETFRFPVPESTTATIKLKLHYEHSPTGGEEGRVFLTFYSGSRTVVSTVSGNR